MKKLFLLLFAASIFLLSAVTSQATEKAESKGPSINIRPNPELSAIHASYSKALESLTQQQRDILSELDKESAKANQPYFESLTSLGTFIACANKDPSLNDSAGAKILANKYRKHDEYSNLRKALFDHVKKIEFIDHELVYGHLEFDRNMMSQMVQGMANVLIQMGVKEEGCKNLKAELDKGSTPYFTPAPDMVFSYNNGRDAITGRFENCSLGVGSVTPDHAFVSATIILHSMPDGTMPFEFSAKITDNIAGRHLPVDGFWMDFGRLNTRFIARYSKSGDEMLIGRLPLEGIVNALKDMRDNPTVVSIKTPAWPRGFAFQTGMAKSGDLAKFANCAATMRPELAEPLQKAGFKIEPDKQSQVAAFDKSRKNYIYKVSRTLDDPENPGGCTWLIGPYSDGHGMQIIPVFYTAGFVREQGGFNFSTNFWFMAGKQEANGNVVRYSFKDAKVKMTDTSNGGVLDTDKLKTDIVASQRFEIHMPFEDRRKLFDAIVKNGVQVDVVLAEMNQPISFSFPPPEAESAKAYGDCLDLIDKDAAKRHITGRPKISSTPSIPPNAGPDEKYLAYVDQAMADPAAGNWNVIRDLYPDTSFYKKIGGTYLSHASQELVDKMTDNPTPEQITAFKTFMRQNFASIGAHSRAINLHYKTKADYINVEQEKQIYNGLFRSIVSSGDSLNFKTAIKVISMEEVSYVLSHSQNDEPPKPSFQKENGKAYAMAQVKSKATGQMVMSYFELDDRMLKNP
jgi:hypothetical protein